MPRRWHASARAPLVELTALVGYYTMVAMTLNCHEIPLPEGVTPAFSLPQRSDRACTLSSLS